MDSNTLWKSPLATVRLTAVIPESLAFLTISSVNGFAWAFRTLKGPGLARQSTTVARAYPSHGEVKADSRGACSTRLLKSLGASAPAAASLVKSRRERRSFITFLRGHSP